jgi:chromosome segregation ATPase
LKIALTWDTDAIVLGAIVSSIILSFILLVIVFAMRYKAQNERVLDLEKLLKEKEKRNQLLSENMEKLKERDLSMRKRLEECAGVEKRFAREKEEIERRLTEAHTTIDTLNEKIKELERLKSELEFAYASAKDDLQMAIEEVEKAQKRNEFWVEQLSELRTKYDALRMRVKRLER